MSKEEALQDAAQSRNTGGTHSTQTFFGVLCGAGDPNRFPAWSTTEPHPGPSNLSNSFFGYDLNALLFIFIIWWHLGHCLWCAYQPKSFRIKAHSKECRYVCLPGSLPLKRIEPLFSLVWWSVGHEPFTSFQIKCFSTSAINEPDANFVSILCHHFSQLCVAMVNHLLSKRRKGN